MARTAVCPMCKTPGLSWKLCDAGTNDPHDAWCPDWQRTKGRTVCVVCDTETEWRLWDKPNSTAHECPTKAPTPKPTPKPVQAPTVAPAVAPAGAPVQNVNPPEPEPEPVQAPVSGPNVQLHPAAESDEADQFIPEPDMGYQCDAAIAAEIRRLITICDRGPAQNLGMYGEAGSGKTTLAYQIGAMRKAPTFVCEVSALGSADEVYTTTTGIEGGRISVRESHFVRGIETPGAVAVINDIALLQNRTIQNGFSELLDPSTRSTWVEPLGRMVTVAPRVLIVASWNRGLKYTGASVLSEQLMDRFRAGALFEVPYPDEATLKTILRSRCPGLNATAAGRLAKAAGWLRGDNIEVSTRALISAGEKVVEGASIGHALAHTVLGHLDAAEKADAFISIGIKSKADSDEDTAIWGAPAAGSYITLHAAQVN